MREAGGGGQEEAAMAAAMVVAVKEVVQVAVEREAFGRR